MNKKPRLFEKYQKEVVGQLKTEFSIKNDMAVPKLVKIVVNMGVGKVGKEKQARAALASDLAVVTGQVPATKVAKISVAAFNLRRGMPVGLTVNLRGARMFDFFDRLTAVVLPRLRDFRGVSRASFDNSGNYTLGMVEHTIFPELERTKAAPPHGLEITIVTNARESKKAARLLELLGMPFAKNETSNIKNQNDK